MNDTGIAQTPSARGSLRLDNPPIIEAILDFDCDMPPGFNLAKLEASARNLFAQQYPKFRTQFLHEHQIQESPDAPPRLISLRGLQSLQFVADDERQVVQIRAQGFSFNRLAPYSTLDDYLDEIHRTWQVFVELAAPIQVHHVRLRYINRILLPLTGGQIELDEFLKIGPRLPAQDQLRLSGFLNQYTAGESGTPNQVKSVLTTQSLENGKLPLIFEIETVRPMKTEPENWEALLSAIRSLRNLKNRVFEDTLTARCLNLFRT